MVIHVALENNAVLARHLSGVYNIEVEEVLLPTQLCRVNALLTRHEQLETPLIPGVHYGSENGDAEEENFQCARELFVCEHDRKHQDPVDPGESKREDFNYALSGGHVEGQVAYEGVKGGSGKEQQQYRLKDIILVLGEDGEHEDIDAL
jgi:hypothetical protein